VGGMSHCQTTNFIVSTKQTNKQKAERPTYGLFSTDWTLALLYFWQIETASKLPFFMIIEMDFEHKCPGVLCCNEKLVKRTVKLPLFHVSLNTANEELSNWKAKLSQAAFHHHLVLLCKFLVS